MKKTTLLTIVLLITIYLAKAQECDIQIEILEDRYMFGQASVLNDDPPVKKIEVNFTSEFMEVVMPMDGKNYLIKVVNEACQAYCSRAKRVRQLHSGDEKLVKNLFKSKSDDIQFQIKECQS